MIHRLETYFSFRLRITSIYLILSPTMNTALVELDSLVSCDDLSVSPVTPSEIVDETSDDAPAGSSKPTDHIVKSIRNKFYRNIKFYESNWSAECVICHKAQYDKKGVTSNVNRHIKTQHTKEYKEWFSQLYSKDKDQKKISDMFTDRRNKSTETSSKSLYGKMHPRQAQLAQSIVNDLIIDLGLPLSLVERSAFIEFMKIVDPKFTLTSRRTLSRSTIPKLYDQMNEKLKVLCDQSRFISLTLDLWTDRRTRSFFAMTGEIQIFLLFSDAYTGCNIHNSSYFAFRSHICREIVEVIRVVFFTVVWQSHCKPFVTNL